jgi:hypothetical protein
VEKPTTSAFVESLPVLQTFEEALSVKNYIKVPDGWFIAVTDVVRSRDVIKDGRFKAVNMAGVAMITGVMNAKEYHNIPYIFAGDGSAIAFAPEDFDLVRDVLSRTRTWAKEELALELRAAIVPIEKIREQKADVLLTGLYVSEAIKNYAFIGRGLALAESLMKAGEFTVDPAPSGEYPDLTGLSCRWMPIERQGYTIISLIVEAAEDKQRIPEHLTIELLDLVEADTTGGHPVPEEQVRFKWPVDGLDLESKATGDGKFKLYCVALLAWVLDKTGWSLGDFNPHHYRKQLALNTDYRKIHDGIRMTLSLDQAKLSELKAFLEKNRAAGYLKYGLSEQDQALLTCFVPSISSDDHYHFMDGAGGGYAAAASNIH